MSCEDWSGAVSSTSQPINPGTSFTASVQLLIRDQTTSRGACIFTVALA
jgi:hypothetical protein